VTGVWLPVGSGGAFEENEVGGIAPLLECPVVNFRGPPKIENSFLELWKTNVGFNRLKHSNPRSHVVQQAADGLVQPKISPKLAGL
jgi:hypothetical protein